MNKHTALYRIYQQTGQLVADHPAFAPAFAHVQTVFETKKAQPDLSVMIYGVYNAGKSTLINALLGAETAPTGDVPLTDAVHVYPWQQFELLDTPGWDAPLVHEQITEAQLQTVDVVIFVVNPSGVAEEEKTLSSLLDLLQANKKVFLLFNEKQPLSPEDFIYLKDLTRSRLQALAQARGLERILADIPIMRVNAARALKGKLNGKLALIDSSGIVALEQALAQFLASVRPEDVNLRLATTLRVFLEPLIAELAKGEQDELARHYQQLHERLLENQAQCRTAIGQAITHGRKQISNQVKTALHQNPEGATVIIEREFETAAEHVTERINTELSYLVNLFHDDVDTLVATIDKQGLTPNVQAIPQLGRVEAVPSELAKNSHREQHKAILTQTAKTMLDATKPEHIVKGLTLIKQTLPTIMKGIGPKTMEKWAQQIIGRITNLGPMITVVQSLYLIFSEDPADKQLREYNAKLQQQQERFERQVDDLAADLAEQFEQAMSLLLRQQAEPLFAQLQSNIETALASVNKQGKANRLALMQAQTLLSAID